MTIDYMSSDTIGWDYWDVYRKNSINDYINYLLNKGIVF